MSTTESTVMLTFSAVVTVLFYFILKALGNESLTVSTFSVTTSFIASYLTFMRSPYYALAYAANDVVLIVLWIIASLTDTSYVTMAVCFFMFLLNDLYGFINWRRMMKRQNDC
jgi:nicotinamide riboside transporter PnuC